MQLFRLYPDRERNARAYPDRYTYNQLRESGQILCTAIELHGGDTPYGATHENHPIVQWVTRSLDNWYECYRVTEAVWREYQRRYESEEHKSWAVIKRVIEEAERVIPECGADLQPCAFDEQYKLHSDPESLDEVCENYRNYVREVKAPQEWFTYERAEKPDFL